MTSLNNRVVAVTGAASGIGRGLAVELARRGARVAASDVNETELAQTRELVRVLEQQVHSAGRRVTGRIEARGDQQHDVGDERLLGQRLSGHPRREEGGEEVFGGRSALARVVDHAREVALARSIRIEEDG